MCLHDTLALNQLEPKSGLPTAKALEVKGVLKHLEFLVRPHGVFIGGYLSAPLGVVKVMK